MDQKRDEPKTCIRVFYSNESGVIVTADFGPGYRYGFNDPNEPPYVRVWRGNHTRIFPMSRVVEIETNL